MILLIKDLNGCAQKKMINRILFDFMKKREIMNLCGSQKSVFKPLLKVVNF